MDEKIAKRYAKAIYDIALDTDNMDEIKEMLHLLSEKYTQDEDFKTFVTSPVITSSEKEKILKKSFIFLSDKTFKIVLYIVDKGRMDYIVLINKEFLELYHKGEGRLPVIAIFSKKISDEQVKRLKERLEKRFNKKVVLDLEVDEKIIGGGIIKVGSNVINGSLKHQIENMKRMF